MDSVPCPNNHKGCSLSEKMLLRVPDKVYADTLPDAQRARARFDGVSLIGVDTETSGLYWWSGHRPLFVSLAHLATDPDTGAEGYRVAFPIHLLPVFADLLTDERITKVLSNAKFDWHMLASAGVYMRGTLLDTIYMTFLLDENRFTFDLKTTTKDYLGLQMNRYQTKRIASVHSVLMLPERTDTERAAKERAAHQLLLMMREEKIRAEKRLDKKTGGGGSFDADTSELVTLDPDNEDASDREEEEEDATVIAVIRESRNARADSAAVPQLSLFAAPVSVLPDLPSDILDSVKTLTTTTVAELELLRVLKKLRTALDLGNAINASVIVGLVRKFAMNQEYVGRHAQLAEFIHFHSRGLFKLTDARERAAQGWAQYAENPNHLREATNLLYEQLLALHGKHFLATSAREIVLDEIAEYSSLDPWCSARLGKYLAGRLKQESVAPSYGCTYESLWGYNVRVAAEMTKVLVLMERRGITFDPVAAATMSAQLHADAAVAEREMAQGMAERLGRPGNINSNKDLVKFLFDYDAQTGTWTDAFGIVPSAMTKTGPSTAKAALKELEERGEPRVQLILRYRALQKLCSTYIDSLPEYICQGTGRIHTTIKQHAAVTGRLASTAPALLNVPVRGENGKRIRRMFRAGTWGQLHEQQELCFDCVRHIPLPDLPPETPMLLAVGDYTAAELMLLASFSGDAGMLAAIRGGRDLHCSTVAYAYPGQYTYEEVYDAHKNGGPGPRVAELRMLRSQMKTAIFGIIYGIGPVSLARTLGLRVERVWDERSGRYREVSHEGKAVMDRLHAAYPGIQPWINSVQGQLQRKGYVTTLAGRRRRLPMIHSKIPGLRARAGRQGPNAAIQGSVFDLICAAMIRIEKCPILRACGARMLLQIHDELIIEYPDTPGNRERVESTATAHMNAHMFLLDAPPKAEMHSATNWGEAK